MILAIGSTALATTPDGTHKDVEEAVNLQAHAEKALVVAFMTGSKSCEIIQAHILFHMWSFAAERYLDDNRWVRLSMCSRIAMEIGLHRHRLGSLKRGVDDDCDSADPDTAPYAQVRSKLAVNDVRTRAFLIMAENRRVCVILSAAFCHAECIRWTLMAGDAIPGIFSLTLTEIEVEELSRMPSESQSSTTAALYTLSRFIVSVWPHFWHPGHFVLSPSYCRVLRLDSDKKPND